MDSSDLRNQLDQTKSSTSTEQTDDQPDDPEPESPINETAETDTSESIDDEERDSSDDEINDQDDGGPAFTTQESDKTSIYPHEENSYFLKVVCNGVESDLLALGHDDFEIREAHDAMVRLANKHQHEVTQLVLEARGLDPDAIDDLS